MPFTQIDDNTIQDEQGNRYFMPGMGSVGAGGPPGMTPTMGPPGETPPDMPDPGTVTPPSGPPSLATGAVALPSTQVPEDPYQGAVNDFAARMAPPRPAPTKQQVAQAGNNLMTNDVVDFSRLGGTAKTDEDYARMAGGHAAHEAETAQAKFEADKIAQAGHIEKLKAQAGLVADTAAQYDAKVTELTAQAKSDWADWKKKNDAAAKQLVDPRHAFKEGGTLSKINWSLYFLGAGLQGGNSVDQALGMMNKFIEDDINVQKTNIDTRNKTVNEERLALQEHDKTNKDNLSQWYFAKNLRLQAVGQALDAKIAEIGAPAAQKAGLLAARDVIEKEVLKNQEHVGDHYFTDAQRKAKDAQEIYMARLQSNLRKEEDLFKAKIKKGEDKGDTLPTGTGMGLQVIDKSTGQNVPLAKIPIKVKGEKAVEAGQLMTQANEEASQLQEVKDDLSAMSTVDLVRGGTPEFKSKVKDLIQTRAVRDNGHRLSDADVDRAAQEEFGIKMTDSLIGNGAEAYKLVGPYREGVQRTIDDQLRNLATKTKNRLQPYVESDFAQQHDIQFNPQQTHLPKPKGGADDINTAITKAAGGSDVSDLTVPGPRSPVTQDQPGEVPAVELKQYEQERGKGRGNQGGLPRMPQQEEAKVEQATASFAHAPVDDILRLAQSYLRDKSLSEEAKHEIRLESLEAMKAARATEADVREKAAEKYQSIHHVVTNMGGDEADVEPEPVVGADGNYTEAFKSYLQSDVVNEMRRRAGLEPRSR